MDVYTIVLQIINFVIIIFILNKFLYLPLLKFLDKKKSEYLLSIKKTKIDMDSAAKMKEHYEKKLYQLDLYKDDKIKKIDTEINKFKNDSLALIRNEYFLKKTNLYNFFLIEKKKIFKKFGIKFIDLFQKYINFIIRILVNEDLQTQLVRKFCDMINSLSNDKINELNLLLQRTKSGTIDIYSGEELTANNKNYLSDFLSKKGFCFDNINFFLKNDLILGVELKINDKVLTWNVNEINFAFFKKLNQDLKNVEHSSKLLDTIQENIFHIIHRNDIHIDGLFEKEIGTVVDINDYVLTVKGFSSIMFNEIVLVDNTHYGYISLIKGKFVKVILLNKTYHIRLGAEVKRTGKVIEIGVGDNLIGKIINPLGYDLKNDESIVCQDFVQIDKNIYGIFDRDEISQPLQTGIKAIDCFIPIGKGQRELILGDRQIGKTSLVLDIITNQKDKNVLCIYCAIGKKDTDVINVINLLEEHKALDYTIVINASASTTAGLQYIAPLSAISIAEYFCKKGRDVLVVYDDLSKHAKAYREISLLMENSPGREAYPADVFYLHSKLLERSINVKKELGGGSITSLPIIETEAENISSYISTNVISITDGQIYLSPNNFFSSQFPAIDVGKSVSRVGGSAQLKAYKKIASRIALEYSQFEELEMFSKFSLKVDDDVKKIIDNGKIIKETLKQDRFNTVSVEGQIAMFIAINNDLFKDVDLSKVKICEKNIISSMSKDFPDLSMKIKNNETLNESDISLMVKRFKEIIDSLKYIETK